MHVLLAFWYRRGAPAIRWGVAGDRPVIMDVNGDGRTEITIYRPSSSTWWRRGADVEFSSEGLPMPGAFNTSRGDDLATFYPWNGDWEWFSPGGDTDGVTWGVNGDMPI